MGERGRDIDDDATVVRPRAAATSVSAPQPAPAVEGDRQVASSAGSDLDAAYEALSNAGAHNGIVRAATPLLLLAVQLRHSTRPPDLGRLRTSCAAKLERFESDVHRDGVDAKQAMMARYVLCTLLDEAVLAAPWGDGSGWSQRTLLVTFHGETYGGAKVFDLLDRLSRDPARYLDLLEMIYLAMALGFGGRYLIEPGGQARLADRMTTLHALIRRQRGAPAADLSPHWKGADRRLGTDSGSMPFLIAALASLCILLAAFIFLHSRLNGVSAPVSAQLAQIGLDRVRLPDAPVPVPDVSLATLLQAERDAGLLTLEVGDDGRTTIRIAGAVMFGSGGSEVDPAQRSLLQRVGTALDRVDGRVVVVGHTDNQPVRGLRFKDNFELSTVRAESVGTVLRAGMRDSRRVEISGAGDSQPVAVPPDLPENRALNRRVEIVLIPEA